MIEQMNDEEIISKLIQRYEAFKKKWLKLNEQDMFDRVSLKDEIVDNVIELKSKYLESKSVFDRDYWLRLVELKDQKGEDWKKLYTDTTAKAICDDQLHDREIELIHQKKQYELLLNKAENVIEYINVVKLSFKKDFSI